MTEEEDKVKQQCCDEHKKMMEEEPPEKMLVSVREKIKIVERQLDMLKTLEKMFLMCVEIKEAIDE